MAVKKVENQLEKCPVVDKLCSKNTKDCVPEDRHVCSLFNKIRTSQNIKAEKLYRVHYRREADMGMLVKAKNPREAIKKAFQEEHIDDWINMCEDILEIKDVHEIIIDDDTGKKSEKKANISQIDVYKKEVREPLSRELKKEKKR